MFFLFYIHVSLERPVYNLGYIDIDLVASVWYWVTGMLTGNLLFYISLMVDIGIYLDLGLNPPGPL